MVKDKTETDGISIHNALNNIFYLFNYLHFFFFQNIFTFYSIESLQIKYTHAKFILYKQTL
jgi:hypothetical protein